MTHVRNYVIFIECEVCILLRKLINTLKNTCLLKNNILHLDKYN